MPSLACPHCGTIQLAPQPLPRELLCVGCRRPFPAAPATAQAAAGPLPPHLRHAPPIAGPTAPPQSFVAAAPTAPPVAIENRHTSRGWLYDIALFGGIGGVVLAMLLIVAWMMANRGETWEAARQENRQVVVVTEEDSGPNALAQMWADASRKSLRKHGLKVRIDAIELAPLYGLDENQRLFSLGDKSYLAVRFNVRNQGGRSVRYVPWYGNTFVVEGRQYGAMLWDDQGAEYAVARFADVPSVQGQKFERHLEKGEELDDILVFDVPDGVDIAKAQHWRLELPAAAVGEIGAYRFEIPRAMLATAKRGPRPGGD